MTTTAQLPACRDNPELWFDTRPDIVAMTKLECLDCPVLAACEAKALEPVTAREGDKWGVIAAMTPRERANARRRAKRPKRTACKEGHDLTVDGATYARGTCKRCVLDRYKKVRDERRSAA